MPSVPKSRTRTLTTENSPASPMRLNAFENGFDREHLRAVLAPMPLRSESVQEDGVGDEELTPASVLFPIVLRTTGPSVLLTQRNAQLKDHPGQISFPGGRVEPEDASPAHTALREAEEEIGLARDRVEILGYLPEYRTVTGFRVTPVVAFVTPPFTLCPEPGEVESVFEVPLAFLMDSANHQHHSVVYRGKPRQYVAMPYGDRFIWGATAGIILTLSRALFP